MTKKITKRKKKLRKILIPRATTGLLTNPPEVEMILDEELLNEDPEPADDTKNLSKHVGKLNAKNAAASVSKGLGKAAGMLNAASNAIGLVTSLSGESTATNDKEVAMQSLNDVANGISTGMEIGKNFGPIGAGVGAAAGAVLGAIGKKGRKASMTSFTEFDEGTLGTGLRAFGNKKLKRERARIERNAYTNRSAVTGTANLLNRFLNKYGDMDVDVLEAAVGGQIPNSLVYVDDGELINTPQGNTLEVPERGRPTDSNLVNLPVGSKILSDSLKVPGTKKTFAQMGKEMITKRLSKGTDRYAENSRMLNERNNQQIQDQLFELQEEVKRLRGIKPKTKGLNIQAAKNGKKTTSNRADIVDGGHLEQVYGNGISVVDGKNYHRGALYINRYPRSVHYMYGDKEIDKELFDKIVSSDIRPYKPAEYQVNLDGRVYDAADLYRTDTYNGFAVDPESVEAYFGENPGNWPATWTTQNGKYISEDHSEKIYKALVNTDPVNLNMFLSEEEPELKFTNIPRIIPQIENSPTLVQNKKDSREFTFLQDDYGKFKLISEEIKEGDKIARERNRQNIVGRQANNMKNRLVVLGSGPRAYTPVYPSTLTSHSSASITEIPQQESIQVVEQPTVKAPEVVQPATTGKKSVEANKKPTTAAVTTKDETAELPSIDDWLNKSINNLSIYGGNSSLVLPKEKPSLKPVNHSVQDKEPYETVITTDNGKNSSWFDTSLNALSRIGELAPTLMNLMTKDPEAVNANYNPYATAITNTMGRRRYDNSTERERILQSAATANYNASQMNTNTGANLAFRLNNAIQTGRRMAEAERYKHNIDAQYAKDYAEAMNNLGQQWTAESNRVQEANAANRAAARNIRRQGATQLSQWLQRNRLEKNLSNKDKAMLALYRPFLEAGTPGQSVGEFFNEVKKNYYG